MQHQKRILRFNEQHPLVINRQSRRLAQRQRQSLQSHSVESKTRSEGSLQLSRSSIESRERKLKKKSQLKQSLQFVLQQDEHIRQPQPILITKFTHPKQIQTSINFITQALQNHQFPQTRTEIVNFIKQTNKHCNNYDPYIKLLGSVSNITLFIQDTQTTMKSHQQKLTQITKSLQFGNKFFRQKKWLQLQKIKLKLLESNSSKVQLALGLLFQSIIDNNNKAKSKQTQSIFKPIKKLEGQKVTDLEMNSLRREIAKLTVQLEKEKEKEKRSSPQTQTQVKSSSLQRVKKYEAERISMLQKKCLILQLQIDSKFQQVGQCQIIIKGLQSQLCESLAKIQKLQGQKRQLPQNQIQISKSYKKQGFKALTIDIEEIERQKSERDQVSLTRLKEKSVKIQQLQQKLKIIQNKINIDRSVSVSGLLGLQFQEKELRVSLQEKNMEIIRLKKKIIELLQQENLHSYPLKTIMINQQRCQHLPNQQERVNDRGDIIIDSEEEQKQYIENEKFNMTNSNLSDVVGRWVSYESTIRYLQNQNGQYSREIQSLKKQLDLSKHLYQELQRQLKETINQNAQRDNLQQLEMINGEQSGEQQFMMMNALRRNYNKLLMEMNVIEQRVKVLVNEKQSLLKQIHQFTSAIQEQKQYYLKQLQKKDKLMQSSSSSVINLQQQIHQLQLQIQQLSVKNKLLQRQIKTNCQNHELLIYHIQQQHTQLMSRQHKDKQQLKNRVQQLMGENERLIKMQTIQREKANELVEEMTEMRHREILISNQSLLHTQTINTMNQQHTKLLISTEKDKAELTLHIANLQRHNQILITRCQALTNNCKQIIEKYQIKLSQYQSLKQQKIQLKQEQLMKLLKNQSQQINIKNQQLNSLLYQQLQLTQKQLALKTSEVEQLIVKLNQCQIQNSKLNHNPSQTNISQSVSQKQIQSFKQINSQIQSHNTQLQSYNTHLQSHNTQLQSQLHSLSIQLSKSTTQKQLLAQQLDINQQNYVKSIAQLKHQSRKLNQSNISLTKQNSILSDQLWNYKSTIKHIAQQNTTLEEQLMISKLQKEKQLLKIRSQIQNLIVIQIQLKQTITSKDNQITQLKLQIIQLKQEKNIIINQLNTLQTTIKNNFVQYDQLKSKSKQTQINLRNKLQRLQSDHIIEKNKLFQQFQQSSVNSKIHIQALMGELAFYKSILQKKGVQSVNLNAEIQQLKKSISQMKIPYQTVISTLRQKIQQLESNLLISTNVNSNMNIYNANHHQQQQGHHHNKVTIEQMQKSLQITTTKLNQSLEENINLSNQTFKLSKSLSQLEIKLQQKIKQLTLMQREVFSWEMKNKQIQRKGKYEMLHLKAQLDATVKISKQYQEKCIQLLQHSKKLSSKCINQEYTSNQFLLGQQRQHIQNQPELYNLTLVNEQSTQQLLSIKIQLSRTLTINQQLQQKLSLTQKKNHSLALAEVQLQKINKDWVDAKKEIEILLMQKQQLYQHNHQLTLQLNQAKQQLLQLNQILCKTKHQFQKQLQIHRNSQRVLDNQLIDYRSRLENVSESLRQENQRSFSLMEDLQKLKTEKIFIEEELHLQREKNTKEKTHLIQEISTLQRQLSNTRNSIFQNNKAFEQKYTHQINQKDQQISYLNQQLLNLAQQNNHFHSTHHSLLLQNHQHHLQQHSQQQNISFFINQHNRLLDQQQQEKQQLEYNLILEVQSKIQLLVQENNTLKQKLYHKQNIFHSKVKTLLKHYFFNQDPTALQSLKSIAFS